jgi:putative thioredoxin
MKPSAHIVTVNENDFQYEVLAFSNQTPVVVDFWAEWCGPCKLLSPTLEKLADEGAGSFRLAKVDVDANPNLAIQFQVKGIPAVKAFRDGQVVAEFVGARSESDVREFLRGLAPNPGDLAIEKGNSLLALGNWGQAGKAFAEVLGSNPDNGQALLGLAKSHIAQGNALLALPILREFPASKEYSIAEQLLPLADALIDIEESADPAEIDDLLAAYQHSLKLVSLGNIPSAVDGMLDILRQDKSYLNGEVRKVIVGMLHLLGEENAQTKSFRSELASLLF